MLIWGYVSKLFLLLVIENIVDYSKIKKVSKLLDVAHSYLYNKCNPTKSVIEIRKLSSEIDSNFNILLNNKNMYLTEAYFANGDMEKSISILKDIQINNDTKNFLEHFILLKSYYDSAKKYNWKKSFELC